MTTAEYKKLIDSQRGKDISKFSDSDLKTRLDALGGLSKQKAQFDPLALKNEISGILVKNGIPPKIADQYSAQMGNFYAQTGTLKTGLADLGGYGGGDDIPKTIKDIRRADSLIDPLLQKLNDKISGGGFNSELPDYEQDLSSTQNLYDQRLFKTEQEAQLNEFLGNTPQALETERNRFSESQKNRAQDYIQQVYAPQAAAALNGRGLLDTESELGWLIGSQYAAAQGQIEAEKLAQQQADIQFFADMSYKTTYQNLIQQGADISGQLAGEQAAIGQRQQQRFQTSQNNIDNRLNNDILAQQGQNKVLQSQNQADQKSKAVKDQFAYNLAKTTVIAGGTALGAVYGGPVGAAVANQTLSSAIPSEVN